MCDRLASHLGIELVVVRRAAGDMMERWEARWESSKRRYANLETVTLVLPWSTPNLRFCTSELKNSVLSSALRKRYTGMPIINATGVRRQESAARAKQPIANLDTAHSRKDSVYWNWRPIADWLKEDVEAAVIERGLALHEAYTRYGMTRVSCAFCIMSSAHDLAAATTCEDNALIYRRMVELEVASTFGFQGHRWLGDVAPHLLGAELAEQVAAAKARAAARVAAEKMIPAGLRYEAGWPSRQPTPEEAGTLAEVRSQVSRIVGFEAGFLDAGEVAGRYRELLTQKAHKAGTVAPLITPRPSPVLPAQQQGELAFAA